MTAPIMPFGFRFSTTSGGGFSPAYSDFSLPDGVVMLHITLDAPQGAVINRSATRAWQAKVEIGRIEPGAGRRSIVIPGIAVQGNAFLSIDRIDGVPFDEGHTLAGVVYTTPFS